LGSLFLGLKENNIKHIVRGETSSGSVAREKKQLRRCELWWRAVVVVSSSSSDLFCSSFYFIFFSFPFCSVCVCVVVIVIWSLICDFFLYLWAISVCSSSFFFFFVLSFKPRNPLLRLFVLLALG
jgi:hypothetical protein